MDVKKKIVELLIDICATKKVKKDLDMDLIGLGYLDSMGVVELLTEIEDEFEVVIPLDTFDKENFNTANKIIDYVTEALK